MPEATTEVSRTASTFVQEFLPDFANSLDDEFLGCRSFSQIALFKLVELSLQPLLLFLRSRRMRSRITSLAEAKPPSALRD